VTAKALTPIAAWFRSSRRMLAAELSQGGWLNFGTFRWSDADVPRALRAGAGMITPLALGLATGHLEYGVFAALGALPAGPPAQTPRRAPARHRPTRTRCSSAPPTSSPTPSTPPPTCFAVA
jgi:hypothetical protein